ncbi:MAG TPA: hypothetical protein VKJ07_08810, partial [Mycobacteriales bacterium]|nr:hypothetical protein [Mycobacteriales bacterium]
MAGRRTSRLTAAAIAAAVSLTLAAVGTSFWADVADGRSLNATVFAAAFSLAFVAVGAVVAAARPENRVGWVMLVGAALATLGGAGADVAYHGIVAAPGSVPVVAA